MLKRALRAMAVVAGLCTTLSPAFAAEAATSAATVDYQRDWVLTPAAAVDLIRAGALVIDARDSKLRRRQGALPGAVELVWQDLSPDDKPLKGMLLGDDVALTRKLQAIGVSKDRPVLVLADPMNGWGEDGRIAWTLRTLGHPKAVIADGGIVAVRKLGGFDVKPAQPPGDFVVTRTPRWEIGRDELRAHLAKPALVVVDTRERREFEGKTPYGEARGGHVPGARALYFRDLLDSDGRLLPRGDIAKLLASRGITKDSRVAAYCTAGIRSAWVVAVLSDMGYDARNYAGSMWEWAALPAAEYPLAKGD